MNRKTGEIVTVLLSDLEIVEEGREGDEELEWGDDALPLLRSIAESEEWCSLPDKFDIHEWQIMRDFAESLPPNLADELDAAPDANRRAAESPALYFLHRRFAPVSFKPLGA